MLPMKLMHGNNQVLVIKMELAILQFTVKEVKRLQWVGEESGRRVGQDGQPTLTEKVLAVRWRGFNFIFLKAADQQTIVVNCC